MKRRLLLPMVFAALFIMIADATLALARPRSGSSFGGRRGFRAPSSSFQRSPATQPRGYGGPSFIFFPGFGWGGGYGMGGGGSMLGTLMLLGVVGLGAVMVVKAVRRMRAQQGEGMYGDEGEVVALDRAWVYKVQFGLGRSARGIQQRLERFAGEGDTSTEAGLAHLLHQTALELMREKDSIRQVAAEAAGPMSLTNGETKLNAAALAERSRFQVERVRGADGNVRRAQEAAVEANDALEYVVVTLAIATRAPVKEIGPITDREGLDTVLGALGAVPADALLGLEVVWTPADPQDSLTEMDVLSTYPEMRSV